jgi:hypothetical protein
LPLKDPGDTREFPFLDPGKQWQHGMKPGPTRVLYPPGKNTDHIDVGYHDPRLGPDNRKNMNLGVYPSKSSRKGTATCPMGAVTSAAEAVTSPPMALQEDLAVTRLQPTPRLEGHHFPLIMLEAAKAPLDTAAVLSTTLEAKPIHSYNHDMPRHVIQSRSLSRLHGRLM